MPEDEAMDLNDEGVEAAAKAIWHAHAEYDRGTLDVEQTRDGWSAFVARAAITAYLRAVPESADDSGC